MKNTAVVVLAAGEGTRMKSSLPKVLHKVCGKSMISWVMESIMGFKPHSTYIVVGHKAELVKESSAREGISFIEQKKRLGSGHALMQVEQKLKNFQGNILVMCADTPLVKTSTLSVLLNFHSREKNSATVLTVINENPFGYGRILRSPTGQVEKIVEEKDASREIKKIKEINSGIYCFESPLIWGALKDIRSENAKKEYYLTDVIDILNKQGKKVGGCTICGVNEVMGVNSRVDLSAAEKAKRFEILEKLMVSGVTIIDPSTTYISADAAIGMDTVILPGTTIEGKAIVGSNCTIGPSAFISDSTIGDMVEVRSSYIFGSNIGSEAKIGPFSHIRPGTVLRKGVKVGNFSEVKKSTIDEGSKVNHLTYIGDAEIGKSVNIGAGTITCNYDGVKKHKTTIGDRAFIGSNVNFVAPVKIGSDALVGAGSTITEDVPAKALAIARARQVNLKRKT
jgi:bifunctional UDP-N-acetylglucosamine pyrophosphorylase/glucosamine-1-phosphate N-acetyltransferase